MFPQFEYMMDLLKCACPGFECLQAVLHGGSLFLFLRAARC